tara:strand:+ start:1591 stop:1785 length:195 start_codon:yes stop_codon:yes gene_type:complete
MNITETVVEVGTHKVGIICEVRETTEGKSYLVDFQGVQTWKNEGQIMLYLTSEHKPIQGDFLVD